MSALQIYYYLNRNYISNHKIKFSPWNFCVGILVLLLTRTGAGPSANKLQNSFLDSCVKCVFLYVSWLTFFSGTVGKVSSWSKILTKYKGFLITLTIIEFMTCFHEFSKYESTNFATNISQLKKKTNSLCVKKCSFCSFLNIWQNQNKYYTILGKKNRRKIRENMWWTIPISWAARRDTWVICHFLKTKSLLGSPNNITKKDIKQLVSILKLWNKWVKRLMLTYNWPFLCMDKGGILRKDLTFVLSRCGPILIFFFCGSSFFTSSTMGKNISKL